MKRFHVHVNVKELEPSIRFYSTLFGAEPTRVEADYAKWMLEDPRVNFAISTRRQTLGVDHVGFQVDSAEELGGMKAQLSAADKGLVEQTAAACCYATSDKYWVTDPAGIAWETFHTLGSIRRFGEDTDISQVKACCEPVRTGSQESASGKPATSCGG
jgi:lactoylglutathione lyase